MDLEYGNKTVRTRIIRLKKFLPEGTAVDPLHHLLPEPG
jgi:hypothetical protein